MANSPALESIFANAEQQAAGLLETITTAINAKVTTIDDGEKLVLALSEEAAKFNEMLTTLDNTKSQIESGDMTQEEGLAIVEPIVKALKEQCCALQMSGAELSDSEDIDVAEIAVLREIIAGAKSAAEARVVELRTSADPDLNPEVEEETKTGGVLESFMNLGVQEPTEEPAEEATSAATAWQMRNSTQAKNAKILMQNAKKLYAAGSKQKAIEYMTKAKAGYQKCLDEANKNTKWFDTERTSGFNVAGTNMQDKYKKKVTEDTEMASLIVYFEDRVDACQAYLLQWQNKAGNADLKATKAQLKAERKEEKARIKAERKAAKEAAKQKANESYDYMDELSDSEQAICKAMESYADNVELELFSAAMEADGTDDAEAEKSGGILAKIRAGVSKLRNKDKSGINDVDSAVSEAKSAADEAEKTKDPKKILKIVAACAAAIAVLITLVIIMKKFGLGDKANTLLKDLQGKLAGLRKEKSGDGKPGIAKKAAATLGAAWASVKSAINGIPGFFSAQASKAKAQVSSQVTKAKDQKALHDLASEIRKDARKNGEKMTSKEAKAKVQAELGAEATGLASILGMLTNDTAPATESAEDDDDDLAIESTVAVWLSEDGFDDED